MSGGSEVECEAMAMNRQGPLRESRRYTDGGRSPGRRRGEDKGESWRWVQCQLLAIDHRLDQKSNCNGSRLN